MWEAGWQQRVWWGLWAGQPHRAGRARRLGAWRAMEGVLCFPFLGLWVTILGPGACLWGHTEFNRATAHSGPTSLPRNRLPTAVTTSLQVALATLLRTGVLAQLLSNRWCPPFRPHLRLLPSVFPPFQRHQEELL